LYGEASGISGKSLKFKTRDLGVLAVPLKQVTSLSSPVWGTASRGDRPVKRGAVDHDVVVFKETGDQLEGLVVSFDDNDIELSTEGSDKTTKIPQAKIDSILFGGARPPREIPPASVRLSFQSGTVFTVPLDTFDWSLSSIKLKDAAGQEHNATADFLVSVEILGGRVVYLTDLDFAKEEQISFLGTSWPAQINKNALGQPMRVARQTYDRGIGVHTQSTLVYELDGTFDTLAFRVGLDDSAAPLGEAQVSVVLDGKKLWPTSGEGKLLKPGVLSEELNLPIKGGRRLELHADPAGRLDVQGRVDWINVALRRP